MQLFHRFIHYKNQIIEHETFITIYFQCTF